MTEQNRDEAGDLPMPAPLRAGVDLKTLLVEMAALRTEVRKETAAHREQREQGAALREQHAAALEALERSHREAERQRERDETRAVLALVDLADRLDVSRRAAQEIRAGFWARFVGRALDALGQGLAITAERVAWHLEQAGVSRIASVEHPFDPETMRAVEMANELAQPDGIVLAERTAGYKTQARVIRHAEVVVNRLSRGRGAT